jgi:hypothetical protein
MTDPIAVRQMASGENEGEVPKAGIAGQALNASANAIQGTDGLPRLRSILAPFGLRARPTWPVPPAAFGKQLTAVSYI